MSGSDKRSKVKHPVLAKMLELANANYPDGIISDAVERSADITSVGGCGDTLAEFVVIEICDLFDEAQDEQFNRQVAAGAMRRAAEELMAVAEALDA